MNQLANVGDFCPNEECQDYGKLQEKQAKGTVKSIGAQRKACSAINVETARKLLLKREGRFSIVVGRHRQRYWKCWLSWPKVCG